MDGLKDAILQLKQKQIVEKQLLKEQVNLSFASFKPVNLLNTFTKAVVSPDNITNILSTTIGLTAGFFFTRKLIKTPGSLMKKVIGSLLLFGVTKIFSRKPGTA
jgi:hypothetical protein